MKYRAQIYADFSKNTSSERNANSQKLNAALIQAGWKFMGSGSFVLESDKLSEVFKGVDLVAKQASCLGPLHFLNFQIVSIPDSDGRTYTAAKARPNALKEISSKPFPGSEDPA